MSHSEAKPQDSTTAADSPPGGLRTETLAQSVVLVVMLTGGQRLIGFARGILFCRWLPAEELGLWDLVMGFLLLAAPLCVLGLPGLLRRYVEHYRRRGQMRSLLRRLTLVSAALAISGVLSILLARDWFAWFIFDDPGLSRLVAVTTATLVVVIVYNFLIELFTSLRQMRVVSVMEISTSVIFATVGLALISWRNEAAMVIIAYGVGTGLVSVAALGVLWRMWYQFPADTAPLPASTMWSKLVPFAAWVWFTNILTNLFVIADRYMIMHFSGEDVGTAAAMVGNYHSSRVVPVLIVSLAGLLAAMILPHLSENWELGQRREAGNRLNLILKAFALATFAGGVVLMLGSSFLFGVLFAGKYDGGLSILPWTITYCAWFGFSLLVQNYLWCAEKGKLVSLICLLGLAANIALNIVLLPIFGLGGAVLATVTGNAVALALTFWWSHRLGMPRDLSVWLCCALPLVLPLGGLPALAFAAAVALLVYQREWIFDSTQKQQVVDAVAQRVPLLKNFRPLIVLQQAKQTS